MDFTIPQTIAYFIAWSASLTGTWNLFDRGETVINEKIKKKFSAWLMNKKTSIGYNWPLLFVQLFDKTFGKKHFTIKCFFRSSLASLSLVAIFLCVIYFYNRSSWMLNDDPSKFNPIFGSLLLGSESLQIRLLAFFLILGLINLIPDYISLYETRIVLYLMKTKGLIGRFIFLLIDFILTFLVFTIVWVIVAVTFNFSVASLDESIIQANSNAFFLSTFFTSIWVWLFFISSLLIKLINLTAKGVKKIGHVFDVEEKPLRSLGFVSMILITIIFLIIPFL